MQSVYKATSQSDFYQAEEQLFCKEAFLDVSV